MEDKNKSSINENQEEEQQNQQNNTNDELLSKPKEELDELEIRKRQLEEQIKELRIKYEEQQRRVQELRELVERHTREIEKLKQELEQKRQEYREREVKHHHVEANNRALTRIRDELIAQYNNALTNQLGRIESIDLIILPKNIILIHINYKS